MEETEEEVSKFEEDVQRFTHQDAPEEQDALVEETEEQSTYSRARIHVSTRC